MGPYADFLRKVFRKFTLTLVRLKPNRSISAREVRSARDLRNDVASPPPSVPVTTGDDVMASLIDFETEERPRGRYRSTTHGENMDGMIVPPPHGLGENMFDMDDGYRSDGGIFSRSATPIPPSTVPSRSATPIPPSTVPSRSATPIPPSTVPSPAQTHDTSSSTPPSANHEMPSAPVVQAHAIATAPTPNPSTLGDESQSTTVPSAGPVPSPEPTFQGRACQDDRRRSGRPITLTSKVKALQKKPPPGKENNLSAGRNAPAWLQNSLTHIMQGELGLDWHKCVKKWLVLEAKIGYGEGENKVRFPVPPRPLKYVDHALQY
jgi:hypothetical protein